MQSKWGAAQNNVSIIRSNHCMVTASVVQCLDAVKMEDKLSLDAIGKSF